MKKSDTSEQELSSSGKSLTEPFTMLLMGIDSTDEVLTESIKRAKQFMELSKGDIVVTTGSFPNTGESRPTNLMKIEEISE